MILAVSGGPDSTALMFLAARWRARRKSGPKLLAVTVDHKLRPSSAREAAEVSRVAARLGVEHRVRRWTGPKPKSGIQEAAREARYRLLAETARREHADHILTAHTREDQAETILFRLARGSGITGLAGMARTSRLGHITLMRPLLDFPKARLVATLEAADVPFLEDPSNADPRFARTRLRELAVALAREGLDAERLATLGRRIARAEAALSRATEQAVADLSRNDSTDRAGTVMDRRGLAALPTEIALRVLGRALARMGAEGRVQLGKLEKLLDAVLEAAQNGIRLRRTLAGAMITVDGERVVVERAPPRRARY